LAPHLGHAYGGPGLGPEELSGAPVPYIGGPGFPIGTVSSELAATSIEMSSPPHLGHAYGGPGLGPEELSGAPVPFIGGPGFPIGTVSGELAAPSIEMSSPPAVAVIGQVPEPSSALLLIGAALAMGLLRVRGSRHPLTRRRPVPISAIGPGFRRDDE
jgi:hypothetical protein